jgi:hypothetical protein
MRVLRFIGILSCGEANIVAHIGGLGIIVTIAYTIFVLYFQWNKLAGLGDLELNNFGDFLAGAFGPLAIFWLILGFFQQGAELRNSAETLKLQANELKESVNQQKEIARIANEQFALQQKEFVTSLNAAKERIDPKFIVLYRGVQQNNIRSLVRPTAEPLRHALEFTNVGGTACEVNLSLGYGSLEPDNGPIIVWPQFEIQKRHVDLFASDTHGDSIQLLIEYRDSNQVQRVKELFFVRVSHGDYPRFEIREQ